MTAVAASPAGRVLIVEDEQDLARLIVHHLGAISEHAESVDDGRQGLNRALSGPWDMLVLDIRLPGINGLELCRRVREQDPALPILMLTALGSELDRVMGLECGADDYLVKPFGILELQARARALMRRGRLARGARHSDARPTRDSYRAGALFVDRTSHRAWHGASELSLTRREFDLLAHFASHPGQVFTREQLLDAVWGSSHDGFDHTVNSHINRLRAKLRDTTDDPVRIETLWRVGYRLVS